MRHGYQSISGNRDRLVADHMSLVQKIAFYYAGRVECYLLNEAHMISYQLVTSARNILIAVPHVSHPAEKLKAIRAR